MADQGEVERLQGLIKHAEWACHDECGDAYCPWCGRAADAYEGDEPVACPAFGLHAARKLYPKPEPRTGPLFGLEKIVADAAAESIGRALGGMSPFLEWKSRP